MAKSKKDKITYKQKMIMESLTFQVNWGLKKLYGNNESLNGLVTAELNFINELRLANDILDIKNMVDYIRNTLAINTITEKGDFCKSLTAVGLEIASISNISQFQLPVSWQKMIDQKIIKLYYPTNSISQITCLLKTKGYNTSTYLGKPIVKLNKLWILLDRDKNC